MNTEQYLRMRIEEIAVELQDRNLPLKHRINQEQALKFYIRDLRERQKKRSD